MHEEVFKEMDKLVRFCREIATFGLTVALIAMLVALIWDCRHAIRVGFTSFVIGVIVILLKTVHRKTD